MIRVMFRGNVSESHRTRYQEFDANKIDFSDDGQYIILLKISNIQGTGSTIYDKVAVFPKESVRYVADEKAIPEGE